MVSYWDKDEILRFASIEFLQHFNTAGENKIGNLTLHELLGPVYENHLPYIQSVLSGTPGVFEEEVSKHFSKLGLCIFTYYPEKKDNLLDGFYLQIFRKSAMDFHDPDLLIAINRFNTILTDPALSDQSHQEIPVIDLQMEKVIEYLKSIVTDKFPGLNHIAEIHFMSVSKLKRDFKNACGVSPFIYYRKLQMDLAEQYLKEKKYRIGELATIFNFSNPYNFTSCYNRFKKSVDLKFDSLHLLLILITALTAR